MRLFTIAGISSVGALAGCGGGSETSDGTNTTQLFFPQATENYISTNIAPYKSEGVNNTTNANDHVYTPETQGQTQLTLTGDYNTGYATTVAIYLPITAD